MTDFTITPSEPITIQVGGTVVAHEAAIDPHPQYLLSSEYSGSSGSINSTLQAIADLSTTEFGIDLLTLQNIAKLRQLIWGYDVQISDVKPVYRLDASDLVSGDRWLDSARDIWYFWESGHWLSEQIFQAHVSASVIAALSNFGLIENFSEDLYLMSFGFSAYIAQLVPSGSYWVATLVALTNGIYVSNPVLSTSDLTVSNNTFNLRTMISSFVAKTANANTNYYVRIDKIGNPADLALPSVTLTYRLAR